MEHIAVAVAGKQCYCQQRRSDQCTDDSGAPFGVPILFPETAFAAQAVAMGARHVVCKAAFVNINNGLSRLTLRLDPIPEAVPITVVRLWVPKGFFYMSPPVCAGPEKWHSRQRQTVRHARADRRWDIDEHPAPGPPDRSCVCAAWTDPAPGASTNGKEKRARHQISARFPGPCFLRGDRTRRRKSMQ